MLEPFRVTIRIELRTPGTKSDAGYGSAMAVSTLIDTGAIVSVLDERDRWHKICSETLAELRYPLLTSEAVVTEVFHLAGDSPYEMKRVWSFLRSGVIKTLPIDDIEMPHLEALMLRYSDRPMDFADATLVYLAKREEVTTIFTIDHADFETYRISGHRRFRIFPKSRP